MINWEADTPGVFFTVLCFIGIYFGITDEHDYAKNLGENEQLDSPLLQPLNCLGNDSNMNE